MATASGRRKLLVLKDVVRKTEARAVVVCVCVCMCLFDVDSTQYNAPYTVYSISNYCNLGLVKIIEWLNNWWKGKLK